MVGVVWWVVIIGVLVWWLGIESGGPLVFNVCLTDYTEGGLLLGGVSYSFFEEIGASLFDSFIVVIHVLSSERRVVIARRRRWSKLLSFCGWFSRCVSLNGLELFCHVYADSVNNIVEFRSGDEVLA